MAYSAMKSNFSTVRVPKIPSEPLNDRAMLLFLIDTCYLIELSKSSVGLYNSLKNLSKKGEVIITEEVVMEFQRNAQTKKDVRKNDVAELYRAINDRIVTKERIWVSQEEHANLSNRMKECSEKHNERLGQADASIIVLADIMKELYSKVLIFSKDKDIETLAPPSTEVVFCHPSFI